MMMDFSSMHAHGATCMAEADEKAVRQIYWRENRRWMLILGTIWFAVSLGCGVLWVEPLNQIQLGGFKLGFWFAQQGAIYTFIALIFVYARVMARLEARLGLGEQDG
jgi:putative solute:sodium symporter small subunit